MKNYFTYSLLQYKHSLVLGEALNVGILFHFPQEKKLEFVSGNGYRAKAIYPDFDNSLFNSYIKVITTKIANRVDLFSDGSIDTNIGDYIQKNILARDAAGLIFGEPVQVSNVFETSQAAIEQYSTLLLPGIITEKPILRRHNEQFIIKRYTGYVFQQNKALEKRLLRNQVVHTKNLTLKFELAWQAGKLNLVKPLSFDLLNTHSIQEKAATFFGYIAALETYAKDNNARLDLLISKPQDKALKNDYENALDFLAWAKTDKDLITEDKWDAYFQKTVQSLLPLEGEIIL
jgi:hypothetical protein